MRTSSNEPVWVRAIDRLNLVFFSVAAAVIVVLMLHMVVDVAGRFLFNKPIPGTLEIVTFWWMPIIVFLSLGWAQQRGEHITVTLLTERLSPAWRRFAESCGDVLSLVVVAILAWYTFEGALKGFEVGQSSIGSVSVPIWPVKFIAAIGLVGYFLQLIAAVYRRYSKHGAPEVEENPYSELGAQ